MSDMYEKTVDARNREREVLDLAKDYQTERNELLLKLAEAEQQLESRQILLDDALYEHGLTSEKLSAATKWTKELERRLRQAT